MSLAQMDSLVYPDSTIFEALNVINTTHKRLATVISADKRFLGVISDGDIRRALLAGQSMESKINEIYNRNAFFATETQSSSEVLEILVENSISHIPVVDDEDRFLKMISIYELLQNKRANTVVIMAGAGITTHANYWLNAKAHG